MKRLSSFFFCLLLIGVLVAIFVLVTSYYKTSFSIFLYSLTAQENSAKPQTNPDIIQLPVRLDVSTNAVYPHDSQAFTQGLEFHDGVFYESIGRYGESKLRRVDVKTGKVLQEYALPRQYFGEGMTVFRGKIYQLTWREKTCFVYDLKTFRQEKSFPYQGEGWGITNNGTYLIVSNGSSQLRFYKPENFQLVKTVEVRDGKKKIEQINELEYVYGEIWANLWGSNYIVRINPANGHVIGWINCTNFVPKDLSDADNEKVFNGIAFDAATNRIFITGKCWSVLYELQLNLPK
ncbi:MAG: glutaminyl-peptide cyclotransferase [Planctomycetaceae bacterium]|jgi:glutamine cyclotransferase|nr:glutaminyl-peptide cyclotransferase [Planctomycetaceae bacterium]